jgi:hypothetical protein
VRRRIGLGKDEDKRIDPDESHVARLNARQESEAVAWVLCHPDSGLKSFVDAVRPAASLTGDSRATAPGNPLMLTALSVTLGASDDCFVERATGDGRLAMTR